MPAEMKRLISTTMITGPREVSAEPPQNLVHALAANQNLFEQAWVLQPNRDALGSPTIAEHALAVWQVDPLRNLIQTRGTETQTIKRQIEPRLMHLLCLLASAGGRVISREQLMNELWPKVVVNENSLTRAVSELRKALVHPDFPVADSTRCALIETLSKKGYRLNAQVHFDVTTLLNADAAPPISSGMARVQLSQPRLQLVKGMVIAAALLMLPWSLGLLEKPLSPDHNGLTRYQSDLAESQVSTPLLQDLVVTDASSLPAGVHWLESLHLRLDSNATPSAWINQTSERTTSLSILSPNGDLLAFVEQFPGQSQLKLRSLNSPDESWTAFTSASPITHLQWSPLDDGILFTLTDQRLVSTAGLSEQSESDALPVGRLMLLDLHSLQVRELYRREQSTPANPTNRAGSLT
ncbi:MAG: winged helix-turn-helix domain-containing protein [Pseudohongiella sp.]|nr:winged helix-turn-helix domain-containing protein [Pseudohongiella sp.]